MLYPHRPALFELYAALPADHSRVTVRTAKVSLVDYKEGLSRGRDSHANPLICFISQYVEVSYSLKVSASLLCALTFC